MELKQLSSRVWFFSGDEKTDAPYLYYVQGDNFSIAVDAGNCRAHVQSFYEALGGAGLVLPEITFISHWHWDHSFGIPYVHGKTVSSGLCSQILSGVSKWQWTDAAMKDRLKTGQDVPFCDKCIRLTYPDLSEIKVETVHEGVYEKTEVDLGGVHLSLLPTDSPHSRDALLVFVQEEKVLIGGDSSGNDLYNQMEMNKDRLKSYIDLIAPIDFEWFCSGHGEPSSKKDILGYLNSILNKESFLRPGRPSDIETLTAMSKEAFDSDIDVGAPGAGGPAGYDSLPFYKKMLMDKHLLTFVSGENISGCAIVNEKYDELEVWRVFIGKDFRKKGNGLALMTELEDYFWDKNKFSLETPVWNTRTNNFYKKCGYKEIRRNKDFVFYEKIF